MFSILKKSEKKKLRKNNVGDDNKNILFISWDNIATGGGFISMVDLINILREKYNLNIFVIVPYNGTGSDLLNEFNIPFKIIRSWSWMVPISERNKITTKFKNIIKKIFNARAINKISKFIIENDIDLVHINTTYSYVGAKSAIRTNVPFVWHLREFVEQHQNNTMWDRNEGNNLINSSNKIIVISESLKDKYVDVFDSDKLVRIYDGIDVKKFYNPHKVIFNSDKLIFMITGFIVPPKGQIDLAKACAKLYRTGFDNFEVWFFGSWENGTRREIEDIFSSVNMGNYKFFGYKKNIEEYYSCADISFTCSEYEAFGRTTVEAMLSGNLVIGADSACTKELIGKNHGLLYQLHNIDDLYEKIIFAIENPVLCQNIANNAREFMYKNMTAERNAEKVFEVYSDVLNL